MTEQQPHQTVKRHTALTPSHTPSGSHILALNVTTHSTSVNLLLQPASFPPSQPTARCMLSFHHWVSAHVQTPPSSRAGLAVNHITRRNLFPYGMLQFHTQKEGSRSLGTVQVSKKKPCFCTENKFSLQTPLRGEIIRGIKIDIL